MPRYVAFLRGINVAGQKRIRMEELRGLFEIYGYDNVATYIQSGNVVFDSEVTDTELLRKQIESFLEESFNYKIVTLVRSIDEIEEIMDNNPFEDRDEEEGETKLYVYFMSEVPNPEALAALSSVLKDKEQVATLDREIYFVTPKFGDTKFSNGFLEKKLNVSSTARNWATITKVAEM